MAAYQVLATAAQELEQAAVYYEEASEGLGRQFIDEFEATIARVLYMPEAWKALDENYRRCLFRRFPFALIYRVESQKVIVTSVFHQSRHPGSWRDNH